MQEHIHLAEVQEKEAGFSCFKVTLRLLEDFLVVHFAVGIDAIWDTIILQTVKNRTCARDATRSVEISLFNPVEPRKDSGTDATLKQRTKPQYPAAHLLQELARDPAIEHSIWQEEEVPEPAEGRFLRVKVVKIPVPVLRRRLPRKNARDCARAISQHRAERDAIMKQVAQEFAALDELPAQGVDQHKYVHPWSAFHDRSSRTDAMACGRRKRKSI